MAVGAGVSLLSSCSTTKVATGSSEKGLLRIDAAQFTADTKSLLVRDKQLEFDILLMKINETTYRALYMQCTHQGCELQPNKMSLVCPCHGSEFTTDGKVQSPPADQDLKQFKIITDSENIYIEL